MVAVNGFSGNEVTRKIMFPKRKRCLRLRGPATTSSVFLDDSDPPADKDPNNSGQAVSLAGSKEQSALRAVIKCLEERKLEAEFPPENLEKHLEQLEKARARLHSRDLQSWSRRDENKVGFTS